MPISEPDFQCILLAGNGSARLYPLISSHTPMPLLPLANRPLISYALETMAKNNFLSLHIATTTTASKELESYLSDDYTGNVTWTISIVPDSAGSCEALRSCRAHLNPSAREFILFGIDTLLSDSLESLLSVHRLNNAICTVMLRAGDVDGGDIIGLDEAGKRLLVCESAADIALDKTLRVRKRVLKKFPFIKISDDYQDMHVYGFSKQVFDFLEENPDLLSVKGDLVPRLVSEQFKRRDKRSFIVSPTDGMHRQDIALRLSSTAVELEDDLRCCVSVAKGYTQRADSTSNYLQMNLDILKGNTVFKPVEKVIENKNGISYVDPSVWLGGEGGVPANSSNLKAVMMQIGAGCAVGARTVLQERAVIKKSVVASDCVVGVGARINNSVLMKGVTVGNGANIQNCVLASKCNVAAGITLKECFVASKCEVAVTSSSKDITK